MKLNWDLPEPNLPELDLAIKELEAHPELHFQQYWIVRTSCGTGGCLAGTIALRAGWEPVNWHDGICTEEDGRPIQGAVDVRKDGVTRPVENVARDILGIGPVFASNLFSATNTIEDIKSIRDRLARLAEREEPRAARPRER